MSDLPPLDQPVAYVVVGPDDQRGPYTMELLLDELVAQRLREDTPVWWPGLADWTTMSAHPGVAAELARRRASVAPAPAGGWTEPAPPPGQYQSTDQYPAGPQYAVSEDPAPSQPSAWPAEAATAQGASSPDSQPGTVDPFGQGQGGSDAEIIDVEVSETVELDPAHLDAFNSLVARSSARAERRSLVEGATEALVSGVVSGVEQAGFGMEERNDTDRGAELRFAGPRSDLVVVSLGRPTARQPEDLRSDHVPVTISYRSASAGAATDQGTGAHGEVVVTADEWTGQSTSSVSLFLGLEDYMGPDGRVDPAGVARDVQAAVAVVQARLV